MNETDRRRAVALAKIMWAGFYRCPTNGRVLEHLAGDDKVLCNCGRSNPKVPNERTHMTGCHVVRFLAEASPEDYVDQQEADRARRAAQNNG